MLFTPVLTWRTWSWGQQLPCNGGATHQVKGLAAGSHRALLLPLANLPAAHPRWPSSGNCRSATVSAFGTLPPPRSSPQLWTPPGWGSSTKGQLTSHDTRAPGLSQGPPQGQRTHHGMMQVQAVELAAGFRYHDQSFGSHTVAVRKLEEGEPRAGLANQLEQERERERIWGCGGQVKVYL